MILNNVYLGMQAILRATFQTWGPFLESPDNFSSPKSNIQIEI